MKAPGAFSFALLTLLLASSAPAGASEAADFLRPPPPTPLDQLTADGRPTPAAIALLRSHVRGRFVRLMVDGRRLEAHDLRFDSLEVTLFAESGAEQRLGEPVVESTVAWRSIGGIETRHSNVVPGMIAGAVVLTFVGLAVGNAVLGPEPDAAAIVIGLALPPVGAVLGGIVGARFPRWQHEWPPRARHDGSGR